MSPDHLNEETIGALIDGELTPPEEAVAREHLAGCHACALAVFTAMQLKSATSRAARRFTPSEATLDRLKKSMQPKPQKSAQVIPFRSILWSTAAALLLFAVLLTGWQRFHHSNELTAELVDLHLATLSDSSVPQVISTDRHTVKPWFQGRLPFSFNLPESNALPVDTMLQGADLTYFDGKPTAMLLFTIRKHRVTVFVTQAQGALHPHQHDSRVGFNLAGGSAAGLDFVAVSDATSSDLDSLVSVIRAAQ